jgi:DNA sulfur modification protein DndB
MCPLRLIPKIFLFDEEELAPELRAQRTLNRGRIPDLARYVVENQADYVFSAITASIDADVTFLPFGDGREASKVGVLRVPMDAKFIINDGQHRRAAIELAIRENPDVGDETIAVVFFMDRGLQRCQQMFADLNRHAVKPSKSLGVLYDHRDDRAQLARLVVMRSDIFRDIVELERTTLSARSRKLFTLSAIYSANSALLDGIEVSDREEAARRAIAFWEAVAETIPQWAAVRDVRLTAGEVRQDYLHSHGVVLQALGAVGNTLLREHGKNWKRRLSRLKKVDWSRSNSATWEGRAMLGGQVKKSTNNVLLTANAIKMALGLELAPEEQRVEEAMAGGVGRGKQKRAVA